MNEKSGAFADARSLAPGGLWSVPGLAVAAVCVVGLQARCQADDLSAIVESYRAHDRAIRSLSVEYDATTSALGPPEDVVRYLKTSYLPVTHETFTWKEGMRHYTLSHAKGGVYDHLLNREPDGSPSQVKVVPGVENATNGTLVFTLDGKKPWRRHPAGIIGLPDRQPGSDDGQFNQVYLKTLLRALPDVFGLDPIRHRHSLVGLADQSLLRLTARRETIAGVECAVLEWIDEREHQGAPGETLRFHNTIWCDPALDYAIRRHDVLLDDERTLLSRTHLNDFTEVAPGAWYPRHVRIDRCADPGTAPRDALGKPLTRSDLVVTKISVNDVSDDLFTPPIPPGTTIADARFIKDGQAINYVQPATQAELEQTIAGIMADDQSPPSRRPVSLAWLLAANVLIVLAVVAWFRWRKRGPVG